MAELSINTPTPDRGKEVLRLALKQAIADNGNGLDLTDVAFDLIDELYAQVDALNVRCDALQIDRDTAMASIDDLQARVAALEPPLAGA